MATAQPSHAAQSQLAQDVTAGGQTLLFVGLIIVLIFSVLTVWTYDRWAVTGVQVGIFSLTVLTAFRSGILRAGSFRSWLPFPFFIAAGWGLVQLGTYRSVYRFETWSAIMGWITWAFAAVVAFHVFESETLRRRFRLFAIYFGAVLAVWAILQLFSAEGKILWIYRSPDSSKPMGPFLNLDHYSACIELLLPIALWEAWNHRQRSILYGCITAIMYASVIAGASRAGSILVSLEIVAILILFGRSGGILGRGGRGANLRIALLVLAFTAIVGWDVLQNRFGAEDPFSGRREMWQGGLAMIHDYPWMGVGLGTWPTAYPRYAVFDAHAWVNAAHNDWLQWAGEGGIPFAVLLLIVAVRCVQLGFKAPWGLGVTAVFLHCLVDFPLQKVPVFLWLVVILAALERAGTRARSNANAGGARLHYLLSRCESKSVPRGR